MVALVILSLIGFTAQASTTCGAVPPVDHLVAIGTASGPRAEATLEALEIAHTRLSAQVCHGLSAARCAAVKPYIRDWAPAWDQDTRTACAQAAIERTRLAAAEAEGQALEAKVDRLATSLSRGLQGYPLWVEPPKGSAERRVAALVHSALARTESLSMAEVEAGAGRLRLHAEVGPSSTVIAAYLDLPQGGPRALEGFTVANDVLGAGEAASGAVGEELTLVVVARKNAGTELRTGASITKGDKVTVSATVDQPAFLYLVYDDGGGRDVLLSQDGLYAAAGVPVRLPQPGQVLQVDDEAGKTERLTVIATRQPLPRELLTAGSAASTVRRMRGFDLIAEGHSGGGPPQAPSWLSDPTPVVRGYGAAVYTLSLEHL